METLHHKIIFVGGVHGVGKTTLCKSLCSKLEVFYSSASDLIKKFKKIDFPSSKYIKNIEENQDILISAINEYLDSNKCYLMDGHFSLLDQEGRITKIPISTYTDIFPIGIILLYDDPRKIYSRFRERDKEKYDMNLLISFQEEELLYSKLVAAKLDIPYLNANPLKDSEIIINFVNGLL